MINKSIPCNISFRKNIQYVGLDIVDVSVIFFSKFFIVVKICTNNTFLQLANFTIVPCKSLVAQ